MHDHSLKLRLALFVGCIQQLGGGGGTLPCLPAPLLLHERSARPQPRFPHLGHGFFRRVRRLRFWRDERRWRCSRHAVLENAKCLRHSGRVTLWRRDRRESCPEGIGPVATLGVDVRKQRLAVAGRIGHLVRLVDAQDDGIVHLRTPRAVRSAHAVVTGRVRNGDRRVRCLPKGVDVHKELDLSLASDVVFDPVQVDAPLEGGGHALPVPRLRPVHGGLASLVLRHEGIGLSRERAPRVLRLLHPFLVGIIDARRVRIPALAVDPLTQDRLPFPIVVVPGVQPRVTLRIRCKLHF